MDDGLAGVVLAAGAGSRLVPLSRWRPKALCPVAGVPLVDLALERVHPHVTSAAVNLHHGRALLDAHLAPEVHRSFEEPEALGTAGAIGLLRPWIDGRHVLVANADAWIGTGVDLESFVAEWDRDRVRLLCIEDPDRADFGTLRYCGVGLLPARVAAVLEPVPSGLYEVSWRAERGADRLDLVVTGAEFVDCASAADYLDANLRATGGVGFVDPMAVVGLGAQVTRSVVWDGAEVAAGEVLDRAIRTAEGTILIR